LAQSLRARAHLVVPRRRDPVQMLAQCPYQLPPAQAPEYPDRLLQVFDFLCCEGAPRKEQRGSVSNQGVVSLRRNPHYHLKSDLRCPDPLCEKINFQAGLKCSRILGNWRVRQHCNMLNSTKYQRLRIFSASGCLIALCWFSATPCQAQSEQR